jgi:AraC-like DNA-binding protein
MDYHYIAIDKPVDYHLTGKFEALTEDWKHSYLLLEDYELFVITKGILYLEYNNRQYTVKEGEMLLLPPVEPPYNTRKGYESSACSFYWMHFGIPALPPPPAIISTISIPEQTRLANPEKIVILMKQLQDMVRGKATIYTLNYMTTSILCQVYDDVASSSSDGNGVTSLNDIKKSRSQLYNDMVDYITHNIHSKLTVYQIAKHFGYNEKYISRMFSSITGLTLKQFILQKKAEEASFFLTDTNLSIEEIAGKLGYSDSHNFTRSYKRQTGLAPTEYRNAFSKRVLNH